MLHDLSSLLEGYEKDRKALLKERASLDTNEEVVYRKIEEELKARPLLTASSTGFGMVLGIFLSGFMRASPDPWVTLVTMIGFAGGGAVVALGLNYVRRYCEAIVLEYQGPAFERVEFNLPSSNYTIIANEPSKGLYRIKCYGDLLEDLQPCLRVFVKKKNIPENARRIEEIDKDLLTIESQKTQLKDQKTLIVPALTQHRTQNPSSYNEGRGASFKIFRSALEPFR